MKATIPHYKINELTHDCAIQLCRILVKSIRNKTPLITALQMVDDFCHDTTIHGEQKLIKAKELIKNLKAI